MNDSKMENHSEDIQNDFLDKLFVISLIKEGETYSYIYNKNYAHNSYFTALYRSYNGENRNIMFKKIELIFKSILKNLEIINEAEERKDIIILLKGGMNGLNNLMITYEKDEIFCENIKELIIFILNSLYEEEFIKKRTQNCTLKNKILSKWSKQEIKEIISSSVKNQVKNQAFICAGIFIQKAIFTALLI